jgi:lipopolysaccharide export system protein LptA
VLGNVLRAFYTPRKGGGTDLTRLDAEGNVKISSPTQIITGQAGVYDMIQAILVISGRQVKFVSGTDVITANQQMEYYERKQMAVARGGAKAVHDNKSLSASTLVAHFRKTKNGGSEIHQVDAFENVNIVTPKDHVRSDKGVYNVTRGIATLVGRVRISRGENVLSGDKAEVDLNTGISKLLMEPGVSSATRGQVRGLIQPHRPAPDR